MAKDDEHVYMKNNLWWLTLLGAIHIRRDNITLFYLHRLFAWVTVSLGLVLLMSHVMELVQLRDIMVVADNVRLSSLLVFSYFKYVFVASAEMTSLVRRVQLKEQEVLRNNDAGIVAIFNATCAINDRVRRFFVPFSFYTLLAFFINPLLQAYVMPPPSGGWVQILDNQTVYLERPMPFRGDFPFNKYKHFNAVIVFHVISGIFTCTFTVLPDAFFWSLMMFVAGHIKMMQYKLKNFRKLALDARDGQVPNRDAEDPILLRYLAECVQEHREIITFVDDFDNKMKWMMLVDSGLTTLQVSLMLVGCMMYGVSMRQLDGLQFLWWTVTQLFFFYYCANEVLLAGLDMPMAIYESDWYNCSNKIKKVLLFILCRAQRPLVFNVGPFYQMSIYTMLNILKTAFSYFAVMRTMYAN